MIKKIFALAMVIGVLGAILGGCAPAADGGDTTTPAATAGDAGATTG